MRRHARGDEGRFAESGRRFLARLRAVPPWAADGALALVLLAAAVAQLSTPYAGPRPFIRGGAIAVAHHAALLLPLVLRRRFPLAVLTWVAAVSALGPLFEIRDTTAQAFALTLVAYGIVAHSRESWRSVVGAGFAIGVYWQHVNPFVAPWPITWWNFAFLALVVYAGFVQNRRLRLKRDLDERRQELAAHRQHAPERALVAERARIATDLQAVVTRAVSRMVALARRAMVRLQESDDAMPDLQETETLGREAMSDMRRLLGVLRRESNGTGSRPRAGLQRDAEGSDEAVVPPTTVPDLYPGFRVTHPRALVDGVLVAVLAIGVLGELTLYPPGSFGPNETELRLAGLGAVAAIMLRRVLPLPVVLAQSAALLWLKLQDLPTPFAAGTAILVTLFTTGAMRPLPEGMIGAVAAMSVSLPSLLDPAADGATFGQTAPLWVSIGWALWLGRSSRRADELNAELRDMIAEIERNQQDEVRMAVLRERARVAREMHDVVAHSLSLMTVQAGAARSVAEQDAAGALRSLAAVESSGRAALDELEEIQRFLRGTDGPSPSKGLDDLPQLVREAGEGGVAAELRIEGEPRELRDALALSAYRIVQEALTNIRKHATGATALVTVRHDPEALEVEIVDDGRAVGRETGYPGAGQGLVGMRERAAVFGGEVRAGPGASGGFEVRARLPLVDQ